MCEQVRMPGGPQDIPLVSIRGFLMLTCIRGGYHVCKTLPDPDTAVLQDNNQPMSVIILLESSDSLLATMLPLLRDSKVYVEST